MSYERAVPYGTALCHLQIVSAERAEIDVIRIGVPGKLCARHGPFHRHMECIGFGEDFGACLEYVTAFKADLEGASGHGRIYTMEAAMYVWPAFARRLMPFGETVH